MQAEPAPRGFRAAALTLAFGSGFAVLAVEIAGARLLAPTFGLSTIPWTAIIAVVLTGLALGNALGGRLADRGRVPLASLVALAAVAPLLAVRGEGIPEAALRTFGFVGGATVSAVAFLGPPSALLGAVTPYVVRRYARALEELGSRAGEVGALATIGGIAGSLVTGLLLLPAFPLDLVLAALASLLLLLSALAAALEASRRRWPLSLALLAPLALIPGLRGGENPSWLLYEGQSMHASIRVVETEWPGGMPVIELWQNGSRSSVEIRGSGEPAHHYQITAGAVLEARIDETRSLLVLGGAANTFPLAVKRWRPRMRVDVVEIDPHVVRIARRFFAYGTAPEEALGMHVEDARLFLRREGSRYDAIFVDVYDNLYALPWTMVTREAFSEMEGRLAPGGFVMMTVTTPLGGPGSAFLTRLVATAGSVFPAVRVVPAREEEDPRSIREVLIVMARDEAHLPRPDLPTVEVEPAGSPFTDRHAPVEFLQARIFLHDPAWN